MTLRAFLFASWLLLSGTATYGADCSRCLMSLERLDFPTFPPEDRGTADMNTAPRIKADADGHVYAVWIAGNATLWDLWFRSSPDHGLTYFYEVRPRDCRGDTALP